jgi:hypothetical protein
MLYLSLLTKWEWIVEAGRSKDLAIGCIERNGNARKTDEILASNSLWRDYPPTYYMFRSVPPSLSRWAKYFMSGLAYSSRSRRLENSVAISSSLRSFTSKNLMIWCCFSSVEVVFVYDLRRSFAVILFAKSEMLPENILLAGHGWVQFGLSRRRRTTLRQIIS